MSYVDHIISAFGGIRAMARRLGRPSSTVAGWASRGTIPDAEKAAILSLAQADGLGLTPLDFFPFDRTQPAQSSQVDSAVDATEGGQAA